MVAALLLFIHDFGVNDRAFLFLALFLGFGAGLAFRFAGAGLFGRGLVKLGRDGLPGLVEFLAGRLDSLLDLVDGRFDFALVCAGDFVGVVLEHFLGAIDRVIGFVARLDLVAVFAVVLGMRLGVLAHVLDLFLAQAAAGCDRDLLLFARAQVFGADMQDAVGVNVERHFDLRHAARGGRDVRQVEFADGFVIAGQLAFPL